MSGRILAIGGGRLGGSPLEDFMLSLARVDRPHVCFIGTASPQRPEYLDTFYDSFRRRSC